MNLIIDIGNTHVKSAVFEENNLLEKQIFELDYFFESVQKIFKKHPIQGAILSSVSNLNQEVLDFLSARTKITILDYLTPLPFYNKYKTPETLGVDRIALIAAAVTQFPNKNVLVFDAGSCLTYDFVNAKKEYFGGAISPGIQMRYEALHHFTAKLPKLKSEITLPKTGNSTQDAIHLGVLNGIILEIDGIINQYKAKNGKLTVVLTGGDTIFLAKNIKSSIFANPNFLLEGLNSILTYKKDE